MELSALGHDAAGLRGRVGTAAEGFKPAASSHQTMGQFLRSVADARTSFEAVSGTILATVAQAAEGTRRMLLSQELPPLPDLTPPAPLASPVGDGAESADGVLDSLERMADEVAAQRRGLLETELTAERLVSTPTEEWALAALARDQAAHDLCCLHAVRVAACVAHSEALAAGAAGLRPVPVPSEAQPGVQPEAWRTALGLARRTNEAVEQRRAELEAGGRRCDAALERAHEAYAAAARVIECRVRCEELLGQLEVQVGEVKKCRTAATKQKEKVAALLEDDSESELEEENEDDDRELREEKASLRRKGDRVAQACLARDGIVAEIQRWGAQLDGGLTGDLATPEVVRAQRQIKRFKRAGDQPEEAHVRQLLERKQLLVSGRSLKDFLRVRTIEANVNVEVMRLRGESAGEKVLKVYSIRDFKAIQRSVVMAARLQHEGIVPIEAAFIDGGKVYIQMKYYAGGNLREWCEAGRGDEAKLLAASRIAKALAHVHQDEDVGSGICHRDLKPENIVLDGTDDTAPPALTDFDESLDMSKTAATTARVTLYYVAPEADPGFRADVWSLGVTLFELLACDCKLEQLPVQDRDLDMGAIMAQLDGGAAGAAGPMLKRMLARDPADRPTAAAVARHLEASVDAALREQFASLQSGFDAQAAAAETLAIELERVERAEAALTAARQLAEEDAGELERRRVTLERERADVAKRQEAMAQERRKLRRQVAEAAKESKAYAPPHFWTKGPPASGTRRVDVTREMKEPMNWLFNHTANPRSHGFGHDSHDQRFRRFEVVKVERLENMKQWRLFSTTRALLKADPAKLVRPAPLTAAFRPPGRFVADLDPRRNEHYFFRAVCGSLPCRRLVLTLGRRRHQA